MIEPYQAVGLIQTMRGIRRREEIQANLEHISHMVKAAIVAVQHGPAGAADLHPRGRPAGLHRRGARPRPLGVCAYVRDRHPGARRPSFWGGWRGSGTRTWWRRPRRATPSSRAGSSTSAS